MNCPNCGAANPEGNRFCGRCGNGLEMSPPAPSSPGPANPGPSEGAVRQARGVVGRIAALLAAAGLGMAADYLRIRVAAPVATFACGCLLVLDLLLCIFVYVLVNGLGQAFYGK